MTNRTAGTQLWQRGYYDHIIRDQLDYDTIWRYIDVYKRQLICFTAAFT